MKSIAIIPAFNEEHHIQSVITAANPLVSKLIVIDDGSQDETAQRALSSGATVISHPMNLGKGAACRTGFEAAIGEKPDIVITLDGDGQHDPSEIPNFIQYLRDDSSIGLVLGNRMSKLEAMPLIRMLTNRFLSKLLSILTKQNIPDSQCGFRALRGNLLEQLHFKGDHYDAESEVIVSTSRLGYKIASVPILTIYGSETSHIKPIHDSLRFILFFIRSTLTPKRRHHSRSKKDSQTSPPSGS
jgi:glycosyltransferase involved in cell wall biosynthesis